MLGGWRVRDSGLRVNLPGYLAWSWFGRVALGLGIRVTDACLSNSIKRYRSGFEFGGSVDNYDHGYEWGFG